MVYHKLVDLILRLFVFIRNIHIREAGTSLALLLENNWND